MEVKDKEKEEALAKEKQTKDKKKEEAMMKEKKTKGSKSKLPDNIKTKEKPVNKNKLYKREKITNHKCAKGKKKVTGLLTKLEGYSQLTWESLSGINAATSGMVKEYLGSNNLKS